MKFILWLLALTLTACASNEDQSVESNRNDTAGVPDSLSVHKVPLDSQENKKIYSNQRFRNVTVERISEHQFRIKGQGQIFEASFSWVIEDGHEELKKGYEMTDAGAPEWGDFNFVVNVPKKRPDSKLHLILFEISAKDGSRQCELPVPLY
jgi:hypothetical protein